LCDGPGIDPETTIADGSFELVTETVQVQNLYIDADGHGFESAAISLHSLGKRTRTASFCSPHATSSC
jgi:hypothetical protein